MSKRLKDSRWLLVACIGLGLCAVGLVHDIAYARHGGTACEGTGVTAHNGTPLIHGCGSSCPPGMGACLLSNIGPVTFPSGQVYTEIFICACRLDTTITEPDGTVTTIYGPPQYDQLNGFFACDVYSLGQSPIITMGCAGACISPQTCKKDPITPDPVTGNPRFKCNCQ